MRTRPDPHARRRRRAVRASRRRPPNRRARVAPFTTISNSGPVNLRIEVGKAQSVVV